MSTDSKAPRRWKFYGGDVLEEDFEFVEAEHYDQVATERDAAIKSRDHYLAELASQRKWGKSMGQKADAIVAENEKLKSDYADLAKEFNITQEQYRDARSSQNYADDDCIKLEVRCLELEDILETAKGWLKRFDYTDEHGCQATISGVLSRASTRS